MCPVEVLEENMLPVFAEAEISFSLSLQLSLVSTLLLLNELFANGSFQLSGNTVQLCFRTPLSGSRIPVAKAVYENLNAFTKWCTEGLKGAWRTTTVAKLTWSPKRKTVEQQSSKGRYMDLRTSWVIVYKCQTHLGLLISLCGRQSFK